MQKQLNGSKLVVCVYTKGVDAMMKLKQQRRVSRSSSQPEAKQTQG